MVKSVLLHIGLLLLPSALYLAWLFIFRRHATDAFKRWHLPDGPWVWLSVGGLILVSASLVTLALTEGYDVGSTYEPAHYEEGELVPGRTE
jgi:hypothetical protein